MKTHKTITIDLIQPGRICRACVGSGEWNSAVPAALHWGPGETHEIRSGIVMV